jgi:hypothetical protein
MTTAIVAYIVGALAGLTIVLLTCEHFAAVNRRINADIAEFNAEYPRRHLRVVRDSEGQAS